jgi:hypothetical protein
MLKLKPWSTVLSASIVTVVALVFAGCAASPDASTADVNQGLSCEYSRYPCNPYDGDGEWLCSWACGYTAHCREYSVRELQLCANHPNQVVSQFPYLYCNKWGSPTWNTWCEPTLLASPPPEPPGRVE